MVPLLSKHHRKKGDVAICTLALEVFFWNIQHFQPPPFFVKVGHLVIPNLKGVRKCNPAVCSEGENIRLFVKAQIPAVVTYSGNSG